jgi:branched-chain amino acid transport system ATP-binding protein
VLKLEGIKAGYGQIEVLHGLDLEVRAGEIVTHIGANGAGKTTTLMTAAGIVKPRAGKVFFDGKDVTGWPAERLVPLGLALSPEGRRIFPRMSVLENLEIGAYSRKDGGAIARDLRRVLELFPILAERKSQAGGTLSGGEQQMLAIGRAMMAGPKLLLLDEPSLGLAPLIVVKIFEVVKQLGAEGTTILLVEQNARSALKLAHRGYVMETGNITIDGPASELLADPRVQDAYLGGDH